MIQVLVISHQYNNTDYTRALGGSQACNHPLFNIRARETVSTIKMALKTHFHSLIQSKLRRHKAPL